MKNSIILAPWFATFFSLSVSAFQEDKVQEFINLLETEAKAGNPIAKFHLDKPYMDGIAGVKKDLTKGFNYLIESAKQGYPQAQYNVAASYKTGEGTPQNAELSLYWYLQTAKNGHAPSQLQASLILDEKGDHKKAYELLKLASMKGEVDAQYMLAHMYYAGTAEPQDYQLGYIWFSISAANGDTDAPKARDLITKKLDAQSLAKAQSEAAQIFDMIRQNTAEQP
ncbi:tetratricopeptide repeat protein [Rheinheimera texasensis]|uniref:tetratricopeptide repeat protein n=1 Tax=Rheinheimera texasensis TaxID=306205 RepID=UPI0004E195B6|nr:tetratricopeptide repeat protein [Rheinheimera texasensis]